MKANVLPDMLSAALAYAGQGTPVFPCSNVDKSPLTPHGHKDATTDKKRIRKWWTEFPKAMIGVPMGPASGVFCVDLDLKGDINGVATWQEWRIENPFTHERFTPSGRQASYISVEAGHS